MTILKMSRKKEFFCIILPTMQVKILKNIPPNLPLPNVFYIFNLPSKSCKKALTVSQTFPLKMVLRIHWLELFKSNAYSLFKDFSLFSHFAAWQFGTD